MEPLTCYDAEILLNLRLDGLLDEAGAARLDAHRTACPACQTMLADLEALNATLATLPDVPVPPAVLAGVLARTLGAAPVSALAPANGLARWRWLLRAGLALEAVAAALLLLLNWPLVSAFVPRLIPTTALEAAGHRLADGIGAWLAWLSLQGSLIQARGQMLSDLLASLQPPMPAWNVLAPAAVLLASLQPPMPAWNVLAPAAVLLVAVLLAWAAGNRVLVTVSLRAKT